MGRPREERAVFCSKDYVLEVTGPRERQEGEIGIRSPANRPFSYNQDVEMSARGLTQASARRSCEARGPDSYAFSKFELFYSR